MGAPCPPPSATPAPPPPPPPPPSLNTSVLSAPLPTGISDVESRDRQILLVRDHSRVLMRLPVVGVAVTPQLGPHARARQPARARVRVGVVRPVPVVAVLTLARRPVGHLHRRVRRLMDGGAAAAPPADALAAGGRVEDKLPHMLQRPAVDERR